MRTIARMEHSATPITTTNTLIGLRSAALSSHILKALLECSAVSTAGKAQDRPGPQQRRPCSAKLPAARGRRQSPTALTNFALLRPPQLSPTPPGISRASAFRFRERLRVPRGLLPPPVELPSTKLVLFAAVRLDQGPSAGSVLALGVHWRLGLPFFDGSRKHQKRGTSRSGPLPSLRDRFPVHWFHRQTFRPYLPRCLARMRRI